MTLTAAMLDLLGCAPWVGTHVAVPCCLLAFLLACWAAVPTSSRCSANGRARFGDPYLHVCPTLAPRGSKLLGG